MYVQGSGRIHRLGDAGAYNVDAPGPASWNPSALGWGGAAFNPEQPWANGFGSNPTTGKWVAPIDPAFATLATLTDYFTAYGNPYAGEYAQMTLDSWAHPGQGSGGARVRVVPDDTAPSDPLPPIYLVNGVLSSTPDGQTPVDAPPKQQQAVVTLVPSTSVNGSGLIAPNVPTVVGTIPVNVPVTVKPSTIPKPMLYAGAALALYLLTRK